jgi:uncharacterized protein (UPF0332 family)
MKYYDLAGKMYKDHNGASKNNHSISEEVLRTIINRSYYAAFLQAKTTAKINNISGSVHNEVINYFKNKKLGLGNRLADLKQLRTKSDYHLNEKINERDSEKALKLAENILRDLAS